MLQYAALFYIVIFIALLLFLIKTAPLGYEDKKGFHFNNKKQS